MPARNALTPEDLLIVNPFFGCSKVVSSFFWLISSLVNLVIRFAVRAWLKIFVCYSSSFPYELGMIRLAVVIGQNSLPFNPCKGSPRSYKSQD